LPGKPLVTIIAARRVHRRAALVWLSMELFLRFVAVNHEVSSDIEFNVWDGTRLLAAGQTFKQT